MIRTKDGTVVYYQGEWDYRLKAKLYNDAAKEGRKISISDVDHWGLIVWPERVGIERKRAGRWFVRQIMRSFRRAKEESDD